MKKFFAFMLACLMVLSLAACQNGGKETEKPDDTKKVKVGFIFLHDENSTYDKNFMDAAKAACEELKVDYILKTNVDESDACYQAAADLVDQGCNIVFADSFGHESYMIQAAKDFKDVEFCHATGTRAHTENLKNYHNAFATIYEGRFLAGVAAGLKLKEMIDAGKITADQAKTGYVGAYTYAEVVSGYTSYYLGMKYIVPEVTMEVQFTGSWYDEAKEKEAAEKLISDGVVLMSQHADSMGAPTACENAGIPDVSYNGSTASACPNTFIVSSKINWAPYFKYIVGCVQEGKAIDTDWCGTLANEAVQLTEVNEKAAAAGTAAKIAEVKALLEAGKLHVFDTATFTKDGAKLDSYMADVDSDDAYTPDTEVIKDGYFHESEFRSAPYFDIQIDGITLLNVAF
ncbi:MAG: BMP family ABC transporter substrate-binding protein [Lachnospiraceae bacterium]|nr:BMP family ABC transporter substrate-binding protein [Lachnospiraceae bacterium]MBQ6541997.1 BMP family ABC transporter substrate-binding protein [Lachnospiraceae bacterium]